MVKARINGIDCIVFYEERIPLEKAPSGYPYMYHIRHDEDDWTLPISLERFVAVNFFGTTFMNEPIEFEHGYLEIDSFKLEQRYIKFKVGSSVFEEMFGLLNTSKTDS